MAHDSHGGVVTAVVAETRVVVETAVAAEETPVTGVVTPVAFRLRRPLTSLIVSLGSPMPHLIESAKTGRAKCRACGKPIAAGALRFGERVPNPFADDGGETTHWFHVPCAAFTRPEAFLLTLPSITDPLPDREHLEQAAQAGVAHRRLPRVAGAGRASSGRAVCRHCKETIAKDNWRIALAYYEEGRFAPSGFIHLGCAREYLETTDVLDRVRNFSPDLTDADAEEILRELQP